MDIWAEKYRPEKLDEIINQKHIIKRLKSFVEKKNIPHMLFAGPAGCGKTTTALCIAKELYGKAWKRNYLELNASDERGINTIRGKVKDFARIKSIDSSYKIVCLDEADALTQEAQQALRRTMENYSNSARFILICNYSSHIIEPIQSRCTVFRFKSLEKDDILRYLKNIAEKENLNIDEKAFDAIIKISNGDLRKASNLLQSSAFEDRITEETIYSIAASAEYAEVKEMMKLAIDKRFLDARKILHKLLFEYSLSGMDVVKEMSKQVYNLDVPENTKIRIIENIGDCEFRLDQGANEQIQLEALLAKLSLHGNQ